MTSYGSHLLFIIDWLKVLISNLSETRLRLTHKITAFREYAKDTIDLIIWLSAVLRADSAD
jgi:hypothetical protein